MREVPSESPAGRCSAKRRAVDKIPRHARRDPLVGSASARMRNPLRRPQAAPACANRMMPTADRFWSLSEERPAPREGPGERSRANSPKIRSQADFGMVHPLIARVARMPEVFPAKGWISRFRGIPCRSSPGWSRSPVPARTHAKELVGFALTEPELFR